ncbi:hypothetical protein DNU06_04875 [Putridiphycobacter roseus]|uniref:histidine kinase n=1 Tax=Putridiphycobacter roseus TaxID=2219161 RepID=A0A2W1N2A3_9FLAO|nr:PAS domain S-box protein [Putridiphycobacter roseus]PZE17954.1 hypothetical protein DNU06_04875 [Putridiphycobacter roseus]
MELANSTIELILIVLILLVITLAFRLIISFKKQQKLSTKITVLQSEKNQFEHMIETVSDIIYSANIQGEFTYLNDTVESITGYRKEEILGTKFQDIIEKSHVKRIEKAFSDHFEKGLKQSQHELMIKRKDGSTLWVGQKVTSIFNKDNPKQIDGFYGIVRDINDKKQLSLKLSKEEKTLRQITETLNDVFYLFNIEKNKYEYISPNCNNILGASRNSFYENNNFIDTLIHPEDLILTTNAQKNLKNGIAYDIDFRIISNDEIKWINEKSFPILNKHGELVLNSGICRDITGFKLAQEVIDLQNEEISSSIQYAKNLQDAVLPSSERLLKIVPDSFIFFNPKNIVSGDFYVVDQIRTNEGLSLPTLIVGDCTGHGVPGAVLSLMCNVLVRESFSRTEVNSPAEALDFVRNRLIAFLCAHEEQIINDGMDIAFCVLNKAKNQLYFAGAYISCVIIRDNRIIEYKGDRQHVGYTRNPKPFINHIIDIEKGDCVFLFTDGYTDQFGGERNKKYSKKRLHQLLLDNKHLPMKQISKRLEEEFKAWKNDYEQIDDVTFLGIRID